MTPTTTNPRVAWKACEVAEMTGTKLPTVKRAIYEGKLRKSAIRGRYTMRSIMEWVEGIHKQEHAS